MQVALTTLVSKDRQSELRKPSRPVEQDRAACVLCRTEYHAPLIVRQLPPLLHAGLHRMPSVYAFVVEMHSFLHRMVIRCRLRYRAYFLYVGPFEQEGIERLEPNIRTHACIRDIRSFGERNPWATILDLETYRDAWQAGVEWAANNSCKLAGC